MLQNATASNFFVAKLRDRRWVLLMIAATLSLSGAAYSLWRVQSSTPVAKSPMIVPEIKTVTALGRLEPTGEVIKLSAPTSSNGNRVDQLLVKEGDQVKKGQVIAILDSRDRLQAAYEQAQEDVKVAQAKLAITQAGAKKGEIAAQQAEIQRLTAQRQGDINAQEATVDRLESELQNAKTEYNRYEALYQSGAISTSQHDSKRLTLDTAQKSLQEARVVLNRIRSTSPAELNQAKANLARIAEVRPVDVAASQADVNRAISAMNQAKAILDQAYVRSPVNGEILYVHTRSGEVVSNDGIVEIGQTRQMEVVAEVYQSDVSKVRLAQEVRITSDSLPGELLGTVKRIGSQVRRQSIINTDPSTNIDARIVEVRVALDAASSTKAAKYTNLQVNVVIEQ
jgi:HlyD family secretion protein